MSPRFLLAVMVSHALCVFNDLDSLEECWSGTDAPLSKFVWYFSRGKTAILGYWKTKEVKFHFITSYQELALSVWFTTADADPDYLGEAVFVRFLHHAYSLSLTFSIRQLLEGSHCAQPTLKEQKFMLPFLKAEYLQKLIGILLHRHSSLLLHLLFYSIIISISMDSWIFILHPELQPTTTLNIFSYFKYYSTSGHWEIFQLVPLCPFHIFLLM